MFQEAREVRVPLGQGIAGHVAQTGKVKTLNFTIIKNSSMHVDFIVILFKNTQKVIKIRETYYLPKRMLTNLEAIKTNLSLQRIMVKCRHFLLWSIGRRDRPADINQKETEIASNFRAKYIIDTN